MDKIQPVLSQFFALLSAGVTQPRPVMRRIIDAEPDLRDRLTLVALAAAIQAFFYTLAGLLAGGDAQFGVGGLVVLLVVSFGNYAITASLAFHIGRRFGGQGAPTAVASAAAWHAVMSAALSPLQVAALGGAGQVETLSLFGLVSLLAYAGLNIWLLGACMAEAHGFRSTGRVAGVTFALFLGLGVSLLLLIGGLRQA